MASREALAIREELARNRITQAATTLSAQLGKPIPLINAKARDPLMQRALLAEQTADLLESLITVKTAPVDPNAESSQNDTAGQDSAEDSGGQDDSPDGANDDSGASADFMVVDGANFSLAPTAPDDVDNKEQASGDNHPSTSGKQPTKQAQKSSRRGKTKRG